MGILALFLLSSKNGNWITSMQANMCISVGSNWAALVLWGKPQDKPGGGIDI